MRKFEIKIEDFCEQYKEFLFQSKTERKCIKTIERILISHGFESIDKKEKILAGEKIYYKNKNKALIACVVGKETIQEGGNFVFSHIDSPHLDLKPNPFFEKEGIEYFKTHYYGGIKKYQWLTIPLAIHGIIYKKGGEIIEVTIGEKENEPVFYISDLLPHLSKDQLNKTAEHFIHGEELNVIVGMQNGIDDNESRVAKILSEKYGIEKDDFISSEIQLVPAGKAREVGFDGSMIVAYGHDDRASAFCSLASICNIEPASLCKTAFSVFVDKEEVGSFSHSGAQSNFWINFVRKLLRYREGNELEEMLFEYIGNSFILSADVNAGFDPNYDGAFEKENTLKLGAGIGITKYTGTNGKSNTNDADAETIGKLRTLFDENHLSWNVGELGKIEQSWGGTISRFLTNYNAEVIDCSIPVLSMHAPHELINKGDIYELYKGFFMFYEKF